MREVGIEPVEHGFTQARRNTGGHDIDASPDRIAVATQGVDHGFEIGHARGLGAEERVGVDGLAIEHGEPDRAHLRQVAEDVDALRGQEFSRNCAGGHAHHRFARRRTAAAAVVAQAVFLLVRVIGVARPEPILDLFVVVRALVGVFDQQADRCAGGDALEHARQDAHAVRFTTLAGVSGGARAATFDVTLDVFFREGQSGRTAVDDAAERRTVALAEGRHGEQRS